MKDFERRLLNEKEELDTKLKALNNFMRSEIYENLPVEERDRLSVQADIMKAYSNVLGQRISAISH